MSEHTKTVTATCGLWRGLRRGEQGVVPDDGTTAYALANGLCEEVKAKAKTDPKAKAAEPESEATE